MVKIAVLGAGVNGLTCATRIKEKYKNFHVTLISSEFSPNTTGDGSGGLWCPYLCGKTPAEDILRWSSQTLDYLQELWQNGTVNICLMPIYEFSENKTDALPEWLSSTYGHEVLNSKQLEFFNQRYSKKFALGYTFTTFIIPPSELLAYFRKRYLEAKGEIVKAKISGLNDPILKEYDVVINCTGLGAKLLMNDEKMAPIRGQILKVKASWLSETVMDLSNGHYIIPNVEFCVLGGTSQASYDTKLDPNDTQFILDGCKKIIPSVEHAQIVKQWVGLRPGREAVRIQPEVLNGKLFIHNYGHGGSGFTLFWGCSNEVLQILDTFLNKNFKSHIVSKL